MASSLFDQQVRLLAHLTGGAAIFGAGSAPPLDPSLQGIAAGLLRLEARFSHDKRIAKIERILSRTFDLLANDRGRIIREFAETCPPVSINYLENARQFHGFLSTLWQSESPEPPFLLDVAAAEIAYAAVRSGERFEPATVDLEIDALRAGIRRHPSTVLLRCAYDIRAILDGRIGEEIPARCDMRLVVAMPPGADQPLVSEVSSALFDVIEILDRWADPVVFYNLRDGARLVAELIERGLVEIRQ